MGVKMAMRSSGIVGNLLMYAAPRGFQFNPCSKPCRLKKKKGRNDRVASCWWKLNALSMGQRSA